MAVGSCDADEIFRLFTLPAIELEKGCLLLDVRDLKHYKKNHISQAFCVRLSANGKVLAEYSKAEYKTHWSTDVWVGRTVYVALRCKGAGVESFARHAIVDTRGSGCLYGDAGLSKSHPAIAFLASSNCKAVRYFKEGFEAFAKAYPFLTSTSSRGNAKHYPSQILPGTLYLGDWNHATAFDRLAELRVRGIVTIHNNPENLEPLLPKGMRWLPWEVADVETADIAVCFNRTFEFIEEARAKDEAVLVHCGAGVSRSATLVCMYLMRRFMWSAQKAKNHCIERRSVVCPNDGFWRVLCALEPTLGITARSDFNATTGFLGADAPAPAPLGEHAVGGKVPIETLSSAEFKRRREDSAGQEPPAKRHQQGVKSLTVTLEIKKQEGSMGALVVGPIALHQRVIFGRLPSNDVVVEHASISRQHAALSVDAAGSLLLTDLQSGHGTKLDDSWLRANAPRALSKGSTFSFGASTRLYTIVEVDKS